MTKFYGHTVKTACRTLLFALMAFCISGAARADLEITEIMYDPNDEFVWEWIEVRNTSGGDIDLDGWLAFNLGDRVVNNGTGIPEPTIDAGRAANTVIPANSVAVIYDGDQAGFTGFPSFEANDASFRTAWNLAPAVPVIAARFFPAMNNDPDPNDPTPPQSIGFWSSLADYQADLGDVLPDTDPNNTVENFEHTQFNLNFNVGFPNPADKHSISWNGAGSNTSGANWHVSEVGQSGVTTSVVAQVVGSLNNTDAVANPGKVPNGTFGTTGLHITEIMYDAPEGTAAQPEVQWEWIEIYNNSGATINLAGYVVDDGNANRATTNPAGNIAAGSIDNNSVAILLNSVSNVANFKGAWGATLNVISVSGWNNLQLNNDTDTIAIWDSFSDYDDPNQHQSHTNAIARQHYNELSGYPAPANSGSIYLANLGLDPNSGGSWAQASTDDEFRFSAHPDGSVNAVGVSGPGGMVNFHDGGDIGSPGFFESAVIEDADFDENDIVDGRDFLIWQQNAGTASGASNGDGDANGDEAVDGEDLAIWGDLYNTEPLQAMAAVPEPSTLVLFTMALAGLGLRRRS